MGEAGSDASHADRAVTLRPARRRVRGMIDVVFLPGIIAPASIRYAPLRRALGDDVNTLAKDLEVYVADRPPMDYSIGMEVDGVTRTADSPGCGRFHLYGHSGGGAVALAFAAAHPHRVLSLALDEPAVDFLADPGDADWREIKHAAALEGPKAVRAFMRPDIER